MSTTTYCGSKVLLNLALQTGKATVNVIKALLYMGEVVSLELDKTESESPNREGQGNNPYLLRSHKLTSI